MKKLLIAALALIGLAANLQAAPIYGYVQITTTTALTPTLQNGAINVTSGTVRNLNVRYGVAAATGVFTGAVTAGSGAFTGTVTAGTFSPASALSPILAATNTWTAGQVFTSSATHTGAIVISSNVVSGGSQGTSGQSFQSNAGSAPTWVNVPSAILLTTSTWTASQTIPSATIATLNSTTVTVTTITPTGIVGTTTNNNANSGNYGETISSVSVGAASLPTSGNYGDLLSMPLAAGDYLVTADVFFNRNGATITSWEVGMSLTSGNSATGLTVAQNYTGVMTTDLTGNPFYTVPNWRLSVASGTTVYLKLSVVYSVATPTAKGGLIAVRIR